MLPKTRFSLRNSTALLGALVGLAAMASPANADVTISSGTTQNMSCSSGVCAPTADSAVLNVSDLETLLASGNVEVTTTGSGGVQAGNIQVTAALTWSNGSALTLVAADAIGVSQSVSVTGTGGLSLTSSLLSFPSGGNVTFQNLSSALSINGTNYVLVNSVAGLGAAVGANQSGAFALAQSYDASGDGTYAAPPVGVLRGSFEGLGNTISNLSIYDTSDENVGLIGGIYSATVRDIGLVNANVTGGVGTTGSYVGALGGADYSSNITAAYSSGTVVASDQYSSAGGLIGIMGKGRGGGAPPTLTYSYSTAQVEAPSGGGAGGLAGWTGGTIEYCYATGQVSAGAGGVAGGFTANAFGETEYSFATGAVTTGDNSEAGGFSGFAGGKIMDSYATGAVTAGQNSTAGGLFAVVSAGDKGAYKKSYAIGATTAGTGSEVGGLVGDAETASYITYSDEFWDIDTTGVAVATGNDGTLPGMTGLTTSQFLSRLPKGLSKSVWAENPDINNGYPYLLSNPPPE